MLTMRPTIIALLAAAVAAPAAGQAISQFELDNLRIQQEAATRRAVDQANELAALEGRLRTEQAIADLRRQRDAPQVPDPSDWMPAAGAPAAQLNFPTTPDAILADSNRRVREASKPRR